MQCGVIKLTCINAWFCLLAVRELTWLDPGSLQGINGTNELTAQQTNIMSVNAGIIHLTPQKTQAQGVNGIMDLNTSTGCKSHQGFHPTTDKSTGCKWDHGFDHKYRV